MPWHPRWSSHCCYRVHDNLFSTASCQGLLLCGVCASKIPTLIMQGQAAAKFIAHISKYWRRWGIQVDLLTFVAESMTTSFQLPLAQGLLVCGVCASKIVTVIMQGQAAAEFIARMSEYWRRCEIQVDLLTCVAESMTTSFQLPLAQGLLVCGVCAS
jgi:hypothetical protein